MQHKARNGTTYSTDTAQAVYTRGNGDEAPWGDVDWYEETLYRAPDGRWMLYGIGGANTEYAAPGRDDGGSQGGERLTLLAADTVQRWLTAWQHANLHVFGRERDAGIDAALAAWFAPDTPHLPPQPDDGEPPWPWDF